MKKNEQFEVLIEDIGSNGEGICHKDGFTIFVPFALTGETCTIRVLKVKDNIVFAKLINIDNKSEDRVDPICPYYQKCGGCSLQHINSARELEFKKKHIQTCLKKYAGIEIDSIQMHDSNKSYYYRNKCAFPIREIDGQACVCMFKTNSHIPIEILSCSIAEELINKVIGVVSKWLKGYGVSAYCEENGKGDVKFLVCRVLDNKILITLVINSSKLKFTKELIEMLCGLDIKFGLNLNINTKNNNVILSDKFVHIYGLEELTSVENDIEYPISSLSFMQINDNVKTQIYNKVLSLIDDEDVVVDAYSGAGLMSAMIAKKAKQVFGIEIIPQATINATELAKNNKIANLINVNGDCAIELPKLVRGLRGNNIKIVLDPPRKGCDERVIDAIIYAQLNKIIYVSCNPATLARDVKMFVDAGYNIVEVHGYNMFPQTSHIETVLVLGKG